MKEDFFKYQAQTSLYPLEVEISHARGSYIYSTDGKKLMEENMGTVPQGSHRADINVSQLPAGVYMCQLVTSSGVVTKKFNVAR